jgi:hypothetical protein
MQVHQPLVVQVEVEQVVKIARQEQFLRYQEQLIQVGVEVEEYQVLFLLEAPADRESLY